MKDVELNTREVLGLVSKHRHTEWEKLERILLTIDGGTLALSVSIFTNNQEALTNPEILKWSWGFLVAALIFLLLSYGFGEVYTLKIQNMVRKHPSDTISEKLLDEYKKSAMNFGINLTNYASLIFTILGVILLVAFGFYNIS